MSQKHRTDIILSGYECRGGQNVPLRHLRVKLNGAGFPYIVIAHIAFYLSSAKFPMKVGLFGDTYGVIETCSDPDALQALLDNPNLTTDRLTPKQIMRVA